MYQLHYISRVALCLNATYPVHWLLSGLNKVGASEQIDHCISDGIIVSLCIQTSAPLIGNMSICIYILTSFGGTRGLTTARR